jgi:hypothetical protein
MRRLVALRNKLVVAYLAVLVVGAVFAATALAAEVFQPRAWVGPYQEGKHSASGLVDEIQGEGWQYESCVDIALEGGGYAATHCAGAGNPEYSYPKNNGYARVWNAKGGNNEIWGWAYF